MDVQGLDLYSKHPFSKITPLVTGARGTDFLTPQRNPFSKICPFRNNAPLLVARGGCRLDIINPYSELCYILDIVRVDPII